MTQEPTGGVPTLEPFAPLSGTRVLEWATGAAGPFTAKALAALGADVIKIEPPLVGDETRHEGPFPGDVPNLEQSALFLFLNSDKRSVTLDPATSDGRALLRRLIIEWADLLIEDQPPASLEAMGLTYAALSAEKPALVVVSITPFGQDGPYRDFQTLPSQTSHAGGAAYVMPDGFHYSDDYVDGAPPPMQWPRYVSDNSVGVLAAGGAVAALIAADTIGRGQHVDVSKQEAQMHLLRYSVDTFGNTGADNKRRGNATNSLAGTYQVADGWVSVWPGGFGPRGPGFESDPTLDLADWLGNPEWSLTEAWRDPEQRKLRAVEYQSLLQAEFMRYTMDEVFYGLQERDFVVAPVYAAEHMLGSEQYKARGLFQWVQDDDAGRLPYPVLPFKVSGASDRVPGAAPSLGEHTSEVLASVLGMEQTEIAQLRSLGVI